MGGTVAAAEGGTIVITSAGTPQAGKFDGTSITTRVWGRTAFGDRLSRNALPGPGLPVVVILDAKRNGDGSYRLNEIWANVR